MIYCVSGLVDQNEAEVVVEVEDDIEDDIEIKEETVAAVPSLRMLRDERSVSGPATTGANTPTMSNMFPQQYCLRWKYHHSNLQTMFSQLLERQAYCDVTLACEGQTLRAHKVQYMSTTSQDFSVNSQIRFEKQRKGLL